MVRQASVADTVAPVSQVSASFVGADRTSTVIHLPAHTRNASNSPPHCYRQHMCTPNGASHKTAVKAGRSRPPGTYQGCTVVGGQISGGCGKKQPANNRHPPSLCQAPPQRSHATPKTRARGGAPCTPQETLGGGAAGSRPQPKKRECQNGRRGPPTTPRGRPKRQPPVAEQITRARGGATRPT